MVVGDIHTLNIHRELALVGVDDPISLISGGAPCQGFSTVGKKNEHDDRNSLFWQFLRVVREIQPEFVLFENVSGFVRMYGGKMHSALLSELGDLGYVSHQRILNAVDFGVPQDRKRTIVVAHKNGYDFQMPVGGDCKAVTLWEAISDLPPVESGQSATAYATEPQNAYQREMRNNMTVLTEHVAPRHGDALMRVLRAVPDGGSILDVPEEMRPKGYFANTYARLWAHKPAPTITRNFGTPSSSRCIHPYQDRGLTTREGARLQGFPDWYEFHGSRPSKNLQIGNAVPPALGFAVACAIREALMRGKGEEQDGFGHSVRAAVQTTLGF